MTHYVSISTPSGLVEGSFDPQFEAVAEAFLANFVAAGEVGASVSVTLDGETVVDLWGGTADPEAQTPWTKETAVMVFSATKGATALCAHILSDQGRIDLNAPVSLYWPEYARNGKEKTLVRMMLDHSAGLPHVRSTIKPGGYCDWAYMCQLLEAEAPFWEPGSDSGYHAVSFSWLVGELVRRASGQSLGDFFREQVSDPLGIEFWIGLPEEFEPRVATLIPADHATMPASDFITQAMTVPDSPTALFIQNDGGFSQSMASRSIRAAEIGGVNGVTNGRGLAGLYAPLASGGSNRGRSLVGPDQIALMNEVSVSSYLDKTFRRPMRFSLGFMKSIDSRGGPELDESFVIGANAFGHAGAGGSVGFADLESRMSFGYAMNKMGHGLLLNGRGQSLVDAAYRSLNYRSKSSGVWIK